MQIQLIMIVENPRVCGSLPCALPTSHCFSTYSESPAVCLGFDRENQPLLHKGPESGRCEMLRARNAKWSKTMEFLAVPVGLAVAAEWPLLARIAVASFPA